MATIILKGEPRSTNHIYKSICRGKFASVYMSAQGKTLKEDYQWQVKSQWKGKPLTDEVDLRVELFFGVNRKYDIDNYNKLILDALTGIVFEDDSQIVSLLIIKNFDKKNPRVEIDIN